VFAVLLAELVLAPLPASARADVIGETATVDLVAGTLLTDAQVGAEAYTPGSP